MRIARGIAAIAVLGLIALDGQAGAGKPAPRGTATLGSAMTSAGAVTVTAIVSVQDLNHGYVTIEWIPPEGSGYTHGEDAAWTTRQQTTVTRSREGTCPAAQGTWLVIVQIHQGRWRTVPLTNETMPTTDVVCP